jgi:SAM-dependent methyltransferase
MGGAALFTFSTIEPGALMSDAANQWTNFYTTNTEMMYPAEAVIRIFKGAYPNLKMPKPKPMDRILDVGCGDGRHFPLLHSLGLRLFGTEITLDIVETLASRLRGLDVDLRVGSCAKLPFEDEMIDYLLAWNSCYYMGPDGKFEDHVAEMARVLKPGGWLVCSIPTSACFIFKGCAFGADGYVTIVDDHFGLRNGERMRWFEDTDEIEEAFAPRFTNFCHASIEIDWFGLAYDWHVFTAERRT